MLGCLRKNPSSMSHRRQSFFFILSVPLLLSKNPCHARESKSRCHARESVGRRRSPSITGATDRPAPASSSLFSVRGPRQRAQGRRESLQATPRQRSARASSYGVLPRSDPQGRDTHTAWLSNLSDIVQCTPTARNRLSCNNSCYIPASSRTCINCCLA